MSRFALLGAAVWVLCASARAGAHHSFAAEYDGSRRVTLRGTIVRMEWVNPHCTLWIDVKDASGRAETWALELPPPNRLFRLGVRYETLRPGETITATAYVAKDGRKVASAQVLALPDGRRIATGPPGTAVPGEPAQKR